MPFTRDIVVIGGSAGAVEALVRIVPALPAALPARLFVTVHIPAAISAMPAILSRVGHVAARQATDGEATEPSVLYIAPPDHHLLVKRGTHRVVRGPRENGHRPAVDPLFRSAAAAYGARVVCIVLSGNLDDGSAGALAVAREGGLVIIQDPAECVYPGMPTAAIAAVPGATVLPLDRIISHLLTILHEPIEVDAAMIRRRLDTPLPLDPVELEVIDSNALARTGISSGLTCPECHGGIFEVDIEGTQQFRCRVGHAFTSSALYVEQRASIEAALWTALRALEESAEMSHRLRQRAVDRGNERASSSYAHSALTYEQRASVLRDLLRLGLPEVGDGELSVGARPVQQ